MLRSNGRTRQGHRRLHRGHPARSESEDNYSGRGQCYAQTGEFDQAIADFTEAIRLDPKVARHYRNRGNCYGETGEPDKAIADFTEAIRLDPKDEENHSGRGWCYAQTGEHDKAVADFNDASWLELKARLDPVAAGVCDRAIADCTEALRLDPTDAVAYYNRSWRYAQKGEYEKAIDDVTEALRLDPQCLRFGKNTASCVRSFLSSVIDYSNSLQRNPR